MQRRGKHSLGRTLLFYWLVLDLRIIYSIVHMLLVMLHLELFPFWTSYIVQFTDILSFCFFNGFYQQVTFIGVNNFNVSKKLETCKASLMYTILHLIILLAQQLSCQILLTLCLTADYTGTHHPMVNTELSSQTDRSHLSRLEKCGF